MTDTTTDPLNGLVASVDMVFAIIGFCYGVQCLRPLPKTYLSEIAFPFDFCVKLCASLVLVLVHTLHWIIDECIGTAWHERSPTAPDTTANHILCPLLAWTVAAGLLWMEHRRSRTPSILLRLFWLFSWMHVSMDIFGHQHVNHLDLDGQSTLVVTMAALAYTSASILGASCFFRSTPVNSDLIDIPRITTPSAYLHSTNFRFPLSSYGTFGNYDVRSHSTLKPNVVEHHPDPNTLSALSHASTHSISRGGAIVVSIPSATTSIWGSNHFISYKVSVRTEDDRWTLRRQYSDFVSLHDELPPEVRHAHPLPDDDSQRKYLSWKRRPTPMKSKLEKYLQGILSHKTFEPYSSQALCDFLEMEYVDESLFQSAHSQPYIGSNEFIQVV